MFEVGNVLIADDVAETRFACNLAACKGACCVQGASGAPLEPEERAILEKHYPAVKKYLTPEAIATVEREGVWEDAGRGHFVTTCVDDEECVFVTWEGPVAKCSLQKAFVKKEIDFPKPISCHLFPIRVSNHGAGDVLNYEEIGICKPALVNGNRQGIAVSDYLRDPLTRKYGADWYDAFREACDERRALMESGKLLEAQREGSKSNRKRK